jgi:hypothetical protein
MHARFPFSATLTHWNFLCRIYLQYLHKLYSGNLFATSLAVLN